MRSWMLHRIMERVFAGISAGDTSLALRLAHREPRFRFPGRHAFSADYTDIDDVADWLERFAAFGPEFQVDEVAVKGPPWNMRAYIRYRDRVEDPPHGGIYTNEIISLAKIRWFKIVEYRPYLDTQRVAENFGDPGSPTDEELRRRRT